MTSEAVKLNYDRLKEQALGVHLLPLFYVGGGAFTLDGANSFQLNPHPEDATCVQLRARAGEVYFQINSDTASAGSPGYIPQDSAEFIGPLYNLDTLTVFSATASAVCHWMWFKEM